MGAEEAAIESGFSPQFGAVRQPLEKIVADAADQMCVEFLRMVDEALFLAARDVGNIVDETRYLEGRDEIRGRADAMSKNVPSLLNKGMSTLKSPLTLAEDAEASPVLSELSLVAKDEFEEFLTLSQLVSELEPRLKNSLSELDRRFSHLAQREVDERSNPIGPAVVGSVFAEELKNLQSGRLAINVIFRNLRKVLELNLKRLYDDVNALMIDQNVLPAIESTRHCETTLTVYNNSCI